MTNISYRNKTIVFSDARLKFYVLGAKPTVYYSSVAAAQAAIDRTAVSRPFVPFQVVYFDGIDDYGKASAPAVVTVTSVYYRNSRRECERGVMFVLSKKNRMGEPMKVDGSSKYIFSVQHLPKLKEMVAKQHELYAQKDAAEKAIEALSRKCERYESDIVVLSERAGNETPQRGL